MVQVFRQRPRNAQHTTRPHSVRHGPSKVMKYGRWGSLVHTSICRMPAAHRVRADDCHVHKDLPDDSVAVGQGAEIKGFPSSRIKHLI